MNKIVIYITSIIILYGCNSNQDSSKENQEETEIILNEQFEANTRAWSEEHTDYHRADIQDGIYIVESLDSNFTRSSVGSQDQSYLWSLPSSYLIKSKITCTNSKLEYCRFGLLLVSASLEYTFALSSNGEAHVWEYDYNDKKNTNIISKSIDFKLNNPYIFELQINSKDFCFYINDKRIGRSKLRAESWEQIRFFTSTLSSIEIDFLTISDQTIDNNRASKRKRF